MGFPENQRDHLCSRLSKPNPVVCGFLLADRTSLAAHGEGEVPSPGHLRGEQDPAEPWVTQDPALGPDVSGVKKKNKKKKNKHAFDDSVFQRKLKKIKKKAKISNAPKYAEAEEMGPVEEQEEAPSALHIPVGCRDGSHE